MSEPTEPTAADEPAIRWSGALAGALGAAAALATIEVVSLLDAKGTSVTEAVGNRVIDSFAASLKEIAVALFGTSDKAALQIGTAIIAMAVGAAVGARAHRRPNLVVGTFAAFAVVGAWAAWVDPLASKLVALVAVALAALVGIAVTLGLAQRWARASADVADDPVEGPALARRTVLVNGGIAAGALLFTVAIARAARESLRESAATIVRSLPSPRRSVPVPTDTLEAGAEAVEGISPYVTANADFYRIDTALRVPVVDAEGWELSIEGMVDRELTFTYDDLLDRPLEEIPITMLCVSNEVGGTLVGTARWLGVRLADLLEEAGVQPGAEQVLGRSVDGFTAGFPVEVALDGRDALVAVGMNGEPLPRSHGYPARLVVPGVYGYVSATKWLRSIELTTWDTEGYWIPRGWSRLAPIKTSSRIDVPASGAGVEAGRVAVAGVAWAPTRGIERVEVRVDDGPWAEADLGPVASDDTWVQWWWAWDATPGDHQLAVRATDGDGEVQTAARARPDPDGATGHHTISVSVAG
ncbi:MAG: sulfite oxidase [Acidimicrobiales bacterium]|nr:sulfite oxidase [Acidimicrobiales bacterium]